jgi:hypothetical protein
MSGTVAVSGPVEVHTLVEVPVPQQSQSIKALDVTVRSHNPIEEELPLWHFGCGRDDSN